MNFLKEKLNAELILSWFLAFVVLWFGLNEVFFPQNWVGLIPNFLRDFGVLLIIIHGVVLASCGIALVLNFYRKIAALIIALLILEIIINLLIISGLSDIVVRDIGLLGMAIAIIFMSLNHQNNV